MKRWPAFPALLRNAFKHEFSQECLKDPTKRMLERQWQQTIQKLRDMLVVCPLCNQETFVEDIAVPKCICCNKPFTLPGSLKLADRAILLTPKTKVYIDLDNKPDIEVISVPGDRYPVQLKNITTANWTVETPSGKLKSIDPGMVMPVKAGLKISFGGMVRGEII
jgi:hypothetical protein